MKTKPDPGFLSLSAEEAATQALQVPIEWAAAYGRMTAIAEAMSASTGAPVSRQMVGRWLNPDPKKRVQTSFGMGLMLLHVCQELEHRVKTDPAPVLPRSFVDLDICLFANPRRKPKAPAKPRNPKTTKTK